MHSYSRCLDYIYYIYIPLRRQDAKNAAITATEHRQKQERALTNTPSPLPSVLSATTRNEGVTGDAQLAALHPREYDGRGKRRGGFHKTETHALSITPSLSVFLEHEHNASSAPRGTGQQGGTRHTNTRRVPCTIISRRWCSA